MKRVQALRHEFVEYVPDELEDGTIYISISYATAVHRCCCGCGFEVVTPLSPTDWAVTYDGETVSLDPSIGNWSFPCKSHYWIERNMITWAPRWSDWEIAEGRGRTARAKERRLRKAEVSNAASTISDTASTIQTAGAGDPTTPVSVGLWTRLRRWLD